MRKLSIIMSVFLVLASASFAGASGDSSTAKCKDNGFVSQTYGGSQMLCELCEEHGGRLSVCKKQDLSVTAGDAASPTAPKEDDIKLLVPVKFWYECVGPADKKMCVPKYAQTGTYATPEACAGACTSTQQSTAGYNCVNGSCQQVSSGATYTSSSACQQNCTASTSGYVCSNGNCTYVTSGATYNGLSSCEYACVSNSNSNSTAGYNCSNGSCVSAASNAVYQGVSAYSNCSSACTNTAVNTTKYSCSNGNCYQDAYGTYTSASACQSACPSSSGAPSCSASFNPGTINSGQATTLNKTFTNAISGTWDCTGDLDSNPGTPAPMSQLSGTATLYPAQTQTCNYTATSSSGQTASCSASITVNQSGGGAPSCSVYFNPNPITVGNPTTAVWSSTNATSLTYSCSGSGIGSGSLTPVSGGSVSVNPAATQTCTLTAKNSAGQTNTCSSQVTVSTTPPAPNSGGGGAWYEMTESTSWNGSATIYTITFKNITTGDSKSASFTPQWGHPEINLALTSSATLKRYAGDGYFSSGAWGGSTEITCPSGQYAANYTAICPDSSDGVVSLSITGIGLQTAGAVCNIGYDSGTSLVPVTELKVLCQ